MMKIIRQIAATLFIVCLLMIFVSRSYAADLTPDELKKAIENKSKELSDISIKITQAEQDLKDTESKSKSLQNELKKYDYTINQLNLSIKSSEISIQKLNLEIEGLKYDIKDTESQIGVKKSAIAEFLRELQRKDTETTLVILLKNKSIAESLDETQSIVNINSGLSSAISALQGLSNRLSNKLIDSSAKKSAIELESKNLKNRKNILENQKSERKTLLAQTKNREKIYQQLIAQLEKDQESLSKEINDIEEKLRESFDPTLLPSKRPGVLSFPVRLKKDGGLAILTQKYGKTPYSSQYYSNDIHNGIDWGIPIGTPIFAADDGKVLAIDNNDKSYWQKYQYGQYILIEHSNNLSTIYAHLSATEIKKDDLVKRGDLIGYSGNSGYVKSSSGGSGAHLHFGLYWSPSIRLLSSKQYESLTGKKSNFRGLVPIGVTVNPEDYL